MGLTLGHLRFDRSIASYCGQLLILLNYSSVMGSCLMIQKIGYWSVGGLEERLSLPFNKVVAKSFYNLLLPQVQLFIMDL